MCKKSLAVKFYTVKPMYQQTQAFVLCKVIGIVIFREIGKSLKGMLATNIVWQGVADLESMLRNGTYTDPAGIFSDFVTYL